MKRNIITITITLIIIIVTCRYWIIFNPMSVDFDILGKGKCNIDVQLKKETSYNFNDITKIYFNLNTSKHVRFDFEDIKIPECLKIIITELETNNPIEIKNITLNSKKYKVNELKNFYPKKGRIAVKNNSVIIYPEDNAVNIEYNKNLKTSISAKINFKLFIIISILAFLLSCKLSKYVVYFSIIEKKSRIDYIFLAIFFVFLFVPMSYINEGEIAKKENRFLAKWQPLINKEGKFNYKFGKDFNNWFNDRFCLRQNFVNCRNSLTFLIANKCEKGFFDKDTQTIYPVWSFGHYDITTVKTNFKALFHFNEYCKAHNIKLYVLIAPNKADVHTTKCNFVKDNNKHIDFLDYIHSLQEKDDLKIIYPFERMKKIADIGFLLYFKTEHHWTDDGAFIAYQELMKVINKDFPDVKTLTINDYDIFYNKKVRGDFLRDFNYGQDCGKMGIYDNICRIYHKEDYRYYRHKDFNNLNETIIFKKYHFGKMYSYDKAADYRVILLGTSQSENLTEFIPFSFKNVKRIRNNSVGVKEDEEFKIIKRYEKEILDYKPDIIIFCITLNNIERLRKLFEME